MFEFQKLEKQKTKNEVQKKCSRVMGHFKQSNTHTISAVIGLLERKKERKL